MARACRLVAWLCIVLVVVVGCVHLLHSHVQGEDSASAACGLCAVAHLAVLPVPIPVQAHLVQPLVAMPAVAAHAPPVRWIHPSLYVRPPPLSMPRA